MTHRILLADDSVTIRKVVELTFSDEDFTIDSVGDGMQALEHARAQRPDIFISDVIMPGLNGYELCQRVKSDPQLRAVPFLFLKGTFESFDEEKARSCGADGFIVKPFESQEMIAKVKNLIESSALSAAAPAIQAPAATPAPAPETRPFHPTPVAQPRPVAVSTPAPVARPAAPQGIPVFAPAQAAPARPAPQPVPVQQTAMPRPAPPAQAAPARPAPQPVPVQQTAMPRPAPPAPIPAAMPHPVQRAGFAPSLPAGSPPPPLPRPTTAAPPIPSLQPRPAPTIPAIPVMSARPAPPAPPRPVRPIVAAAPQAQPPLQPPPPAHRESPPPPPPPPVPPVAKAPIDDFGFDFGDSDGDRFGTIALQPAAPAATSSPLETVGESDEDLWSEVSLRGGASDLLETPAPPAPQVVSGADAMLSVEESPPLATEVFFEDDAVFEELSTARVTQPSSVGAVEIEPVFAAPAEPLALRDEPSAPFAPPPVQAPPALHETALPVSIDQAEIERIVTARLEAVVRKVLEPLLAELAHPMIEAVAWEVIPDLAEAMIRAEIERVRQATRTD